MFSVQRYAVLLGLAACFVFTVTYFRDGIATTARGRYQPPSSLGSPQKDQSQATSGNPFSWSKVPIRYPVNALKALPTDAPLQLPRVQFDFPTESPAHAAKRKERLAVVTHTFQRCWSAYKAHAWGHDELAPISGGVKDGFGGWAANLVDNLDNLYMMGMTADFEEAIKVAIDIDLSKSTMEHVNVFETTIRHLGGLLAAYDLSGDKRLLDKAKEFGEMLLVPFDTPNRMPITRWKFHEALNGPQEADTTVLVAEIGSLSMEFTRLSQITGDMRWYDAVDRITRIFEKQQHDTHLPGMWPVVVNAKEEDFTQDTFFTLSAMSDSLYEYLPKLHALMGGVDPVFEKMYNGSMTTAIKHNIWRPMTPDDANILMSGNVRAKGDHKPVLQPQGQHLVCFAGGMFALGGKLFGIPEHVEIGKKLTDGCIWAYKALPLGIMPEVYQMIPCKSRTTCHWDEQEWRAAVKGIHQETDDVDDLIKKFRLPKGFTEIGDARYILRPEAIESVFILYRITGDDRYLDAAWNMFTAIVNATETRLANAALADITYSHEQLRRGEAGNVNTQMDSMESFWMAETLKYFFLIFSEPDVINLDAWVFNTEAHPFKRQLPV